MKTESHSINDVLAKNATSFYIPPFQRAYAWGKQEIERYFSDVSRIIDSEIDEKQHDKLEHFFGTLVIKEEKDGFANKSVVVDGQQRLTTTLIFLIALRDLEIEEKNKEYITQNYLLNNSSDFQDKIKLKQVTKDWDSYRSLVNGDLSSASGITYNAYQLFTKLINDKKRIKSTVTLGHYITAIRRMNVAVIFLDERAFKGEDPQIIFETLNSLGKPLSLSDLIRNYILLKMDSSTQSDTYEKVWHPMIENVLNENTSAFLRDFLQLKKATSIKAVGDNNTKEIYRIFKEFVEGNYENHTSFINEVVIYAKWYNWIITTENNEVISIHSYCNKEIKELIRNIFHDIKADAFKPMILGLLKYNQIRNNELTLSDDRFINILQLIRTYLIRRRILGLTQGENKDIVSLCKHIDSLVKGDADIAVLLSGMFYRLRFPNDAEISTQLRNLNFYELKKYSKFILGKIEEHNSKVSVDFRDSKITIEHIMPQKLDDSWISDLGETHKEIHSKYLHNIGNLILTEFNSEMGNKSFAEKKRKLYNSNLYYRCSIINKSNWNEDSILEHQEDMVNWFLDTYALPEDFKSSSNWNTKEIESKNISPLDPNINDMVDGTKPNAIRIEDKTIKVKTWQDIFVKFINYIQSNSNYDFNLIIDTQSELRRNKDMVMTWGQFSAILENNMGRTRRYKTLDGKTWDKVEDLKDDIIFIHTDISASTCIMRIANIMNMYNIPEESVEIILK